MNNEWNVPCILRNARPNNNQLITYYLPVCYLLRKKQYPVNTTYNIRSIMYLKLCNSNSSEFHLAFAWIYLFSKCSTGYFQSFEQWLLLIISIIIYVVVFPLHLIFCWLTVTNMNCTYGFSSISKIWKLLENVTANETLIIQDNSGRVSIIQNKEYHGKIF